MPVKRFGVSIENELLEALDAFVIENGFSNRSQGIRFLIEKNIVERKWLCNRHVAGGIVLLYESGKYDVSENLLKIQQENASHILSSQRFFLENQMCLEIIAVEGAAQELTRFSDKMITLKGIKHGKLIMSQAD
ncbi:nickel-responsive transcriptional regulator NikR [Bacteroidia bacterium]|nr:nickel-responsive transcriptional regulator NikR [Bacteroidia bacterium]GHU89233.1 nickel-responsive transcriptional regulator NikR [Bacteroidia bacterium]